MIILTRSQAPREIGGKKKHEKQNKKKILRKNCYFHSSKFDTFHYHVDLLIFLELYKAIWIVCGAFKNKKPVYARETFNNYSPRAKCRGIFTEP